MGRGRPEWYEEGQAHVVWGGAGPSGMRRDRPTWYGEGQARVV